MINQQIRLVGIVPGWRSFKPKLLVLILATFCVIRTNGAVYYAKPTATGNGLSWANATSLSNALFIATNNDEIWVMAGTHIPGPSINSSFVVANNVRVYGGFAGTETLLTQRNMFLNKTILSGEIGTASNTDNIRNVVSVNASVGAACIIDGLWITAAYTNSPGGGMLIAGSPIISNCVIYNNMGYQGAGAFISNAAPTFTNCIFNSNNVSNVGGAVYIQNTIAAANFAFTNCTFYNNTAGGAAGIFAYSTISGSTIAVKNCLFNNNLVMGNPEPFSNVGFIQANAILSYNYFDVGSCFSFFNITCTGNVFNSVDDPFTDADGADNIAGTTDDDLSQASNAESLNAGTNSGAPATDITGLARPKGLATDMGAYEENQSNNVIFYVKPIASGAATGATWANACTLAAALNNATAGDQIWVMMGIHYPERDQNQNATPTDNRDKTFFVKSGVKVYGGFGGFETALTQRDPKQNITILSGDLGTLNNASDNSYHVVYFGDNTLNTTLLEGVTITSGNANITGSFRNSGGGIFARAINNNCRPALNKLIVSNNNALFGGGLYIADCSPTLNQCAVVTNTATTSGGGMYTTASTSGETCNPVFTNLVIAANSAANGGGVYNTAIGGGTASSTYNFCTVSNNSATAGSGGGFNNANSTSTTSIAVNNSVVWGNIATANTSQAQLYNNNGSGSCFRSVWQSSIPTGLTNAGGNKTNDPNFANTVDLDGIDNKWATTDDGLQLTCGSSAINTASPSSTLGVDVAGSIRPQGTGARDAGAYESALLDSIYTPQVIVSITTGQNPACNNSNVVFTATASNEGSAPQYQWTKNGANISGATNTTYSATAGTNFAQGDLIRCRLTSNAACISTTTVTSTATNMGVSTNVTPAVSIAITSGSNPLCNGSGITYTATPTNGGTTPAYQWTKNNVNISGATGATYTATAGSNFSHNDVIRCRLTSSLVCVTNTNATSTAITMSVTNNVTPGVSIAVTTGTNPTCNGNSVTFTAAPTNGGTTPTYQWTKNGVNINGATSITYTGVAGTAFVNSNLIRCRLTSNATCVTAATATSTAINIGVNALPTASISGANSLCVGQNTKLTASGGTAYLWNTNATTDTLTVSPNSTTTYSVTVTNANSCSAVATKQVTVNNLPNPGINGNDSICSGQSTTLTANGGTGYLWNTNATTTAISVSPSTTTTYSVTATNNQGCSASTQRTVRVAPSLLINALTASPANVCPPGGTTQLSASVNNAINIATFSGAAVSIPSQGNATPYPSGIVVSGLPQNAISVAQVNINGISHDFIADVDMWLTSPTGQIVILMSDAGSNGISNKSFTIKDGAALFPTGFITGSIYAPTNIGGIGTGEPAGATTSLSNFTGNLNGTWSLFVRDDATGSSGNIMSWSITFSTARQTNYAWSATPAIANSGITNPTSATTNATVNQATTYTLAISDNFGCTANTSTPVTFNSVTPAIAIHIASGSNPTCNGSSVTFGATITNGGTTPAYQWTKNGVNISGANASTYTAVTGTNFINNDVIRCVLASNATCASPANVTSTGITMQVTGTATPNVSISQTNTNVCSGGNLQFTALPSNGGNGPTYQWTKNGTNIPSATSVQYNAIAGTAINNGDTLRCIITSNLPCASPATVTSTFILAKHGELFNMPNVATQNICLGQTANINLGANASVTTNANSIIPDNSTTGVSSNANIAGSGKINASTRIEVLVNISHTWDEDLDIFLIGPANCGAMMLSTDNGGNGDNYTNTRFLTGHPVLITSGAAPFSGTFAPEGNSTTPATGATGLPLTALTGCAVNGLWTLRVIDDDPTLDGILHNWSLKIDNNSDSVTYAASSAQVNNGLPVTPIFSGYLSQAAQYSIMPGDTGLFTYSFITTQNGCADTATATVNVNQSAVPSVSIALTAGSSPSCVASGLTLTATPTNGGSSPVYQWRKNGADISGANASTYSGTAGSGINNNDSITCILTSNATCALPNSDTSSVLVLKVQQPISSNNISGNQLVCTGSTPNTLVGSTPQGGIGQTYTYKWLQSNVANGFYSALNGATQQNYLPQTLNNTTYFKRVVQSGVCAADTSGNLSIQVNNPGIWTGALNTVWDSLQNWSCPALPSPLTNVIIPSGVLNMPAIFSESKANNLTIQSNASLTINNLNAVLELYGNLNNSGLLNHQAGIIAFSGNGTQNVAGGSFHKIEVNNTAGINLTGNMMLTDSAKLTDGNITLNSFNLTLGNQANFMSDSTHYVVTNGSGKIVMLNMGAGGRTGNVFVPMGNSTYNGVVLNNTGVADTFNLSVIDSVTINYTNNVPTGAALTNNIVNRTWQITENTIGGSNSSVWLSWLNQNELQGFNRSVCYVAKYLSNTWAADTILTATGSGIYSVVQNRVSSFGNFGVGSVNTLPVSLLSFTGSLHADNVKLAWTTASEKNSSHFVVQKSTDNVSWQNIGTVKARGNSAIQSSYSYTDFDAINQSPINLLYYRLQMVDKDNSSCYSKTVVFDKPQTNSVIWLAPNPAQEIVEVHVDGTAQLLQAIVFDMNGREVVAMFDGNRIDLSHLASGVYTVRIKTTQEQKNIKLVKQ